MMEDDVVFTKKYLKTKEGDQNESEGDEEEVIEDNEDETEEITTLRRFKKMIIGILENNDMAKKRAAKMEIMDFLNLLRLFNEAGVHFK